MKALKLFVFTVFLGGCLSWVRKGDSPIPYGRYNVLECEISIDSVSGDTLRIDLLIQDENSERGKPLSTYALFVSENPSYQDIIKELSPDSLTNISIRKIIWLPLQSVWVRDVSDPKTSNYMKLRRKMPLFNFNDGSIHALHVWDEACKIEPI
ncbi:MAG: hypothetical protein AAB884_00040 [Patescibacteria group bacterium]